MAPGLAPRLRNRLTGLGELVSWNRCNDKVMPIFAPAIGRELPRAGLWWIRGRPSFSHAGTAGVPGCRFGAT